MYGRVVMVCVAIGGIFGVQAMLESASLTSSVSHLQQHEAIGSWRTTSSELYLLSLSKETIHPNALLPNHGCSLIAYAVNTKNIRLLDACLAQKPDLTDQNKYTGYTLLHDAIELRSVRMVEMLLKAGASTDIVSTYGKNPLDLARELALSVSSHEQDPIVSLLESAIKHTTGIISL